MNNTSSLHSNIEKSNNFELCFSWNDLPTVAYIAVSSEICMLLSLLLFNNQLLCGQRQSSSLITEIECWTTNLKAFERSIN